MFKNSLEYLNGLYQGEYSFDKKRFGQGIYIWDSGEMYIGFWKEDQIDGFGLFLLSDQSFLYGNFHSNHLEGIGIYHRSNGDLLIVWHENENIFSCFYNKKEEIAKMNKNWSESLNEERVKDEAEFMKYIGRLKVKVKLMSLEEIFSKICKDNSKNEGNNILLHLKLSMKLEYIGFTKEGEAEGLGAFFEGKKLFCLGNFENGLMNKFGRVFQGNEIYDGYFINGNLTGIGLYHNLNDNVYIYGYFDNNLCRKLIKSGVGNSEEIITTYKAILHKNNKNIMEEEFIIDIFNIFQNFIDYWNSKNHIKTITSVKDENKTKPEIKTFASCLSSDTSSKPISMNHYYSNYFNLDENKEKINKIFIKPVCNRTIYEEAEEELRRNFKNNEKLIDKISKIPIKFSVIDYESSVKTFEKLKDKPQNNSDCKYINRLHQTPKKYYKKDYSPHSTKTKRNITNTSKIPTKYKTQTISKKEFVSESKIKNENSLKNINYEKDIINFSDESEPNKSNLVLSILNKKSARESKNNKTSILSTIKIIPKNSENEKNSKKENETFLNTPDKKLLKKSQTIDINNIVSLNVPPFLKITHSSSLPYHPNDTKQLDISSSSKNSLQKIPEQDTKTEFEQNSSFKNSKNLIHPLKIEKSIKESKSNNTESGKIKDAKDTLKITNILLQASQNYEEITSNDKNRTSSMKKNGGLSVEGRKEDLSKDIFDEEFPFHESESLIDYKVEENQISESPIKQISQNFAHKNQSISIPIEVNLIDKNNIFKKNEDKENVLENNDKNSDKIKISEKIGHENSIKKLEKSKIFIFEEKIDSQSHENSVKNLQKSKMSEKNANIDSHKNAERQIDLNEKEINKENLEKLEILEEHKNFENHLNSQINEKLLNDEVNKETQKHHVEINMSNKNENHQDNIKQQSIQKINESIRKSKIYENQKRLSKENQIISLLQKDNDLNRLFSFERKLSDELPVQTPKITIKNFSGEDHFPEIHESPKKDNNPSSFCKMNLMEKSKTEFSGFPSTINKLNASFSETNIQIKRKSTEKLFQDLEKVERKEEHKEFL